ncbi:ESX secretion-associated protein EspG [Klebsiella pneumoniae]|nr:ESX secretion-associated protein EspG [Klebsiella pneumoniae]
MLLATFPAAPPGRRPTVRVPESSFRSDEQQDEPPESYLQQAQQPRMSSGDRQLAAYRELAATAHARAGQFAANRRDPHGLLKRSSVVRWFDNPAPRALPRLRRAGQHGGNDARRGTGGRPPRQVQIGRTAQFRALIGTGWGGGRSAARHLASGHRRGRAAPPAHRWPIPDNPTARTRDRA